LAVGVGRVLAGWQVRVMIRTLAMDRRVARESVVVSWRPIDVPRERQPGGSGVWVYEVRVHNPGRLPIDEVRVDWLFARPVQLSRSGVLEPPTTLLELFTPVLLGGHQHRWERRLVIGDAEAEGTLRNAFARVHFVDVEGNAQTNYWPRSSRSRIPTWAGDP
jgi:hypothetical protein